MITSGLRCQDIQKYLKNGSELSMTRYMFFNRFFGDDGEITDKPALQMKLIKEVRIEEFGIKTCPVWERKIWTNRENENFLPKINGFEEDFLKLYNESLETDAEKKEESYKARKQIRRIMYFLNNFPIEDKGNYLKTFLNSPMILKLISWQHKVSNDLDFQDSQSLKKNIFHVLQEYFAGIRLPEGISASDRLYITLNRRGTERIRQSTQVVLAGFLTENFEIKLEEEKDRIGGIRKNLIFKLKEGNQKIIFDLPMLDYVVMRGVGLISQVLESSYVDRLENFKGKLLLNQNIAKDTVDIVTLQTNYRFKRQRFRLRGKKLEVYYG
jgi:hypothetical protein